MIIAAALLAFVGAIIFAVEAYQTRALSPLALCLVALALAVYFALVYDANLLTR